MTRTLPGLVLALLLAVTARARADPSDGDAAGASVVEPDSSWSAVFAPLTPPALDDDAWKRLEAGEVLVRSLPPSDGEGLGVIALGLVDASPARVWQVMADCEAQDEFLPRVRLAVVRDRDGDSHTCELVFDLPFPLEDTRAASRNHVRRLPDGGYQRWWELLPGDWSYRRNSGSWTVHPHAEGSLLVSRMDLLPKSALPLWVVQAAQTRQAPQTFEAIRERVRGLGAERSR